MNRIQAI